MTASAPSGTKVPAGDGVEGVAVGVAARDPGRPGDDEVDEEAHPDALAVPSACGFMWPVMAVGYAAGGSTSVSLDRGGLDRGFSSTSRSPGMPKAERLRDARVKVDEHD